MIPRVVFDTNVVLSALVFDSGRLTWLRPHWRDGHCIPLISHHTARELARALAYPKFKLPLADIDELLAEYLPYCATVEITQSCPWKCRDPNDQPFLDLAHSGAAAFLVTGDKDLLQAGGRTSFVIEAPETYRQRILGL